MDELSGGGQATLLSIMAAVNRRLAQETDDAEEAAYRYTVADRMEELSREERDPRAGERPSE